MKILFLLLTMTSLMTGCAGITDLYSAPQNAPKAKIRIAIEDPLGKYAMSGSRVVTNISDLECRELSTPPGWERQPSEHNRSMFLSNSMIEEGKAKAQRMAQDEKPVLDFMANTGLAKYPDPSYMRYVFDIEAGKTHVFHFAYVKEPGRHWTEPGERCRIKKAYRFEPNENAEVRFRVLHDTTPASCQVIAVSLIGEPNTPLIMPKISEKFGVCP